MKKRKATQQSLTPQAWQWLVCPKTYGRLVYDAQTCELVSLSGKLAYPVRSGIPVLLIEEARSLDEVSFQHYAS